MQDQYSRTQIVLGANAMEKLASARVAVFGVGGVGGYVVESLARSGVGELDIIDDDKICLTNINRQILATRKNIGQYKVDVAEERIHEINPLIKVNKYKCFYLPDNKDDFPFEEYDYIVDAIDTVTAKIDIILEAQRLNIPIISAMGCGNRIDPTKLEVTDIYKTYNDPLSKVMRRELKARGVKKLKVVYSTELPIKPLDDPNISCRNHCVCPDPDMRKCTERRDIPGSTAFVPATAGLIIGSIVCEELSEFDVNNRTISDPVYAWQDMVMKETKEEK